MKKRIAFTSLFAVITSLLFAQNTEWKEYFGNKDISINYKYEQCHYPAKGLHHENVLLRLFNSTEQEVTIAYYLERVYNGTAVKADTADYSFIIPAHFTMESTCDDLIEGLYVFSKMLDLKPASTLTSFDLKNLTINGQPIAR